MKKTTYRRILLIGFFVSFLSVSSSAQVVWQKIIGYGNDTSDVANDVYVNPDGSFIVAGTANTGLVAKLDSTGRTVWKTYIPNTREIASVIAFDDTSYLCVGYGISVDTATGNHWGSADVVLAKIHRYGMVIGKRYYGGSSFDYGVDVVKTTDGGFAVLSKTYSTDGQIIGAAPMGSLEFTNAWLFKINPSGNLLWQKTLDYLDSTFNDNARRVLVANDQQLFVYAAPAAYLVDQNTGATSFFNYSYNGQPGCISAAYASVCKTENGDGYLFSYGDFITLSGGGTDAVVFVKKVLNDGTLVSTDTVSGATMPLQIASRGIVPLPGGGYFYAGQIEEPSYPVVPEYTNGYVYNSYTKQAVKVPGMYYDGFNAIKFLPGGGGVIAVGFSSEDIYDPNTGTDRYPNNIWLVKINFNNTIRGNVFVDANNNNVQDAGETGLKNTSIVTRSVNEQLTTQPYTANGDYMLSTATGTYTTKVQLSRPYYTAVPDSANTVFTGNYQLATVNFALHPVNGIKDYAVTVSANARVRPGFGHNYNITCSNYGTDTLQNRNLVFVKDHRFEYILSVPSPLLVSGDSIVWNISNVYPNASTVISLRLQTGLIPQVNIGDTLHSSLYLDSTADVMNTDNVVSMAELVSGSFDPNDKQENYAGNMPLKDVVDRKGLDYLIRFQNTGTDTAFTIVVRDTLDAQLDASSFTMLDASHTYQLNIKDGKYITWTFRDIMLLDSSHNEALSHGYINYRIKPKLPIGIGDVISNRAAIYFDFNPAVLTNNQQTKIAGPAIPYIWKGTANAAWENPANWNMNKVPDIYSAVVIPSSVPNYPQVNSNANCYSISVAPSATVLVKTGFVLNVKGKN